MRPEENPLDLNNFPDENARDNGKQVLQDSSSSGCSKKKSGKKDAKDQECGKVYECRFCSLKFCKSQALGGHMNRHRQERETETLNHARQLVFRNDRTTQVVAPHLGCCPPIAASAGSYHPAASNMGDPTKRLKFPRFISGSSSTHMVPVPPPPQPPQQFLYTSPSRPALSFLSHHSSQHPVNDYYVGHVLSGSHPHDFNNYAAAESNYTCIGAPVGAAFGKDMPLHNQRLDPPSVINPFQDHGF